MSNEEISKEQTPLPPIDNSNEDDVLNIEEFTVDNEKVLLPIYDIKIQEELDSKMAQGVC